MRRQEAFHCPLKSNMQGDAGLTPCQNATPKMLGDASDALFYVALLLLPVDGTRVGIPLPYWTPLAPWFFLAYALANARHLLVFARRHMPFVLMPPLLVLVSLYGWTTIGFHGYAALKSIGSLVLGVACLASLEIALSIKRLPWKPMITVLIATYSFAFCVGVLQWCGVHWQIEGIQHVFERVMYRNYTRQRPQFLFAEPSYIGMHLYGILLPVYWLARDRSRTHTAHDVSSPRAAARTEGGFRRRFTNDHVLAALIMIFAAGSMLMGAGTRIIVDTMVAATLWIVASLSVKRGGRNIVAMGMVGVIALGGVIAVFLDPRLNRLAVDGLLRGDVSMSARIFHMLAPAWAWASEPWHTLFGWGAGNISDAVSVGYAGAIQWYKAKGGLVNNEINGLAHPPVETFTMSGYTSFITEFGAVMALVFAMVVLFRMVRHGRSMRLLCWLLLVAYLYLQFEAYAFYAWPLLVYGERISRHLTRESPGGDAPTGV